MQRSSSSIFPKTETQTSAEEEVKKSYPSTADLEFAVEFQTLSSSTTCEISPRKSSFTTELQPNNSDEDTIKILTVHPLVGEVIDSTEKIKYQLFDFWDDRNFVSAQFIEREGKIYLEGIMKDGEIKTVPFTEQNFNKTTTQIATPVKNERFEDDVEVGVLIALYILLFILLIAVLGFLCLLAATLAGFLFTITLTLSLALLGIVLRAMISSIENRYN
ncbi:MAG: hypothetical protein H0X46_09705 [Bacteroidetes bacterium]|nr:hypothetical protein [Bacteroidota bacterium]